MSGERRRTVERRSAGRIRREVTADDFAFTEQTPLEQGFALVFRREIAPILRRHETLRRRMRRKAVAGIGVSGLAGAGGAAGAFLQGWDNAALVAPFLGIAGGMGSYGYYQSTWSSRLSAEVIPVLCDFLGGMSYGGPALSPQQFEDLGVVPYHSGTSIDDTVTGSHNGFGYTLTEAKLTRRRSSGKGRTRTETVFRGLLIRIGLDAEAPAITFARDRGGLLNSLGEAFSPHRRGRERIETGFPEFEALYETYTSDPEAARRFLTARLTSGLLNVARTETGHVRYVAAATLGRGLYLAIPRNDDFLGLGSLFSPLTVAEDDFHQCLADLDLPRRVIELIADG